jgi:hypothetical protein
MESGVGGTRRIVYHQNMHTGFLQCCYECVELDQRQRLDTVRLRCIGSSLVVVVLGRLCVVVERNRPDHQDV